MSYDKMVAGNVEKQGYPLFPRALFSSELDMGRKNIASNIKPPLPPNWMHWVDAKTGVAYFINKETREWTRKDPHLPLMEQYYHSKRFLERMSMASSSAAASYVENFAKKPANFLELASCKVCMKHMLVAQDARICPRCGGGYLLHFEEQRCNTATNRDA